MPQTVLILTAQCNRMRSLTSDSVENDLRFFLAQEKLILRQKYLSAKPKLRLAVDNSALADLRFDK